MHVRGLVQSTLVLVAVALSSCAPDGSALPGRVSTSSRQFSAEDKVIARSLSLGNAPTVGDDASPYIEALTCSIALESMSERFFQAGKGESHRAAMGQAEGIYSRRVAQLAHGLGKTPEETGNDRKKRADDVPELRDRGLLAIRCLHKLA